jgi:succinate dehydrogenase / fumarate reductase iron-sulfur subunit
MAERMEQEGFGTCSNFRECEAVCPKEISVDFIAAMYRDWSRAKRSPRKDAPPPL